MGLPSRTTSVTTATRLSVILEKSMKALAIGEAIGAVRSRMSMIRTGRVVRFLVQNVKGNQSANWPVALIIGPQRSISVCSVLRRASGVAFSGVGSVVISAKRLIKAGSFNASVRAFARIATTASGVLTGA